MFADIPIDVKFLEEAESDLILQKSWPKIVKKVSFFQDISVFQHFGMPGKLSIFTTFGDLFRKNKVRFGILSIFYVDMYSTKHFVAFILCFPER